MSITTCKHNLAVLASILNYFHCALLNLIYPPGYNKNYYNILNAVGSD